MKDFLEYITKNLVDAPDQINIETEEKDGKLFFKIKVADADIGKIIGRSGKTASAIRVLLRAVAAKEKKRVVLDIIG
jgi:predicted RNA-binding protein YlqC (UPF0109 family)